MVAGLKVTQLRKSYGNTPVLLGVDLTVAPGSIAALLGPSGCGKTTLLRCIAGFEWPEDGEIRLGDQLVVSRAAGVAVPPEQRGLGMVHQSYALWPHLTVAENVAYGLAVRRRPREDVQSRVAEVLALVGLGGHAHVYPAQLSGGQQQRVALARSLAYRPSILLLDEPLSNLDARLREQTRIELRSLLKRLAITAVYVTHDQEEALGIADMCYVMQNGHIVQGGEPEEVYSRPASRYVADFLGRGNVLHGEVVVLDNDRATVATPLGSVQAIAGNRNLPIGARVAVHIRASRLRVSATPPGGEEAPAANTFRAALSQTYFLGEVVRCILTAAGDMTLVADIPAVQSRELQDLKHVWAQLPPDACTLLPDSA